jgi:hypothetical protein
MTHDRLCLSEKNEGFCWECAQLEVIREDERYAVVEQIAGLSVDVTRDEVIRAIEPISGDLLRRKSAPLSNGFHIEPLSLNINDK